MEQSKAFSCLDRTSDGFHLFPPGLTSLTTWTQRNRPTDRTFHVGAARSCTPCRKLRSHYGDLKLCRFQSSHHGSLWHGVVSTKKASYLAYEAFVPALNVRGRSNCSSIFPSRSQISDRSNVPIDSCEHVRSAFTFFHFHFAMSLPLSAKSFDPVCLSFTFDLAHLARTRHACTLRSVNKNKQHALINTSSANCLQPRPHA